jgi:6-phosphogluconolactonase
MAQLTIASDEAQLAELAAERITQLIVQAVTDRGSALVSLAGGTTPRRLYASLADAGQPWRGRIPWPQVHLFWGDERHVPPDHPDSNYGLAEAALLGHVPIPADHVYRIRGEMHDAHAAAADYEHTLERVASASPPPLVNSAAPPPLVASAFRRKHLFDLMLLGLGADAHIASIFSGSELPDSDSGRRRVAAVWAPHLNVWRITLTPETILDSHAIVVLVAGANKADAVYAALEGPLDVKAYPAQLLRTANDRVDWFLDRAAASRL